MTGAVAAGGSTGAAVGAGTVTGAVVGAAGGGAGTAGTVAGWTVARAAAAWASARRFVHSGEGCGPSARRPSSGRRQQRLARCSSAWRRPCRLATIASLGPAVRQSAPANRTAASESHRAAGAPAHGPSCPPARPGDSQGATPARRRLPRPPPVAPSTCARSSTQAPEPSPEELPRPPALRSQRKRRRRPDIARTSRDAARRRPHRPLTARQPTRPPAARRPRSRGRRHQPPQAPWPAATPTSAPDRSAGQSSSALKLTGAGPHPRASGPRLKAARGVHLFFSAPQSGAAPPPRLGPAPQGGAGCPLCSSPRLKLAPGPRYARRPRGVP